MDGAGRPAPAADAAATGSRSRHLLVAPARGPAAQRLSAGPIFGRAALAGAPAGAARARRARRIATDGRRWTCMGPLLIGEIERLRRERGAMSRCAASCSAGAGRGFRRVACCCRSRRSAACSTRMPALASALLVELRLPRALLALAYGATLGASGAAIQALFANPLASPDLTGTTSGAALGAVVTAYLFGFSAPIALSIGVGGGRARRAGAAARAGRAEGRDRDPAACRPRDQRAGRRADHAGAGARPLPLRFLRRL